MHSRTARGAGLGLDEVARARQFESGDSREAALLHYVRALTAAGYRVHLARSGERSLDAADREALAGAGASVYQRRNAGLDFGAWQDLIAAGAAVGAGEILLANDSVLGPFAPLRPIRHAMGGFDAWGRVSSRECRRHLQSWFVSMTASSASNVRQRKCDGFLGIRPARDGRTRST